MAEAKVLLMTAGAVLAAFLLYSNLGKAKDYVDPNQLYQMTDRDLPFKGHIVSESGGNFIFHACNGRKFLLFGEIQFKKARGTC